MECGSLLPLSARLLAGALWAGSKLPAQKAGASSRTPYRHDFDVTLSWYDAHLWAYAECYGLSELLSEDFQSQRLYGTVRVVNPFLT